MKTLSITLDDETFARLDSISKRENARLEDMAAAYLAEGVANDDAPGYVFTAEDLAAIAEGLAQSKAGQVYPHEQVVAEIEAILSGYDQS